MALTLCHPELGDIPELLGLYRQIYGDSYPLEIGRDGTAMAAVIESGSPWLVARNADGAIAGSAMVVVDSLSGLGKLQGVVVHPDRRCAGLARQLVGELCDEVMADPAGPASIYATTRMLSPGPQLMCLRNGFRPLGILPNARRIERHETLAVSARFRDGVLSSRLPVPCVPDRLAPLTDVMSATVGMARPRIASTPVTSPPTSEGLEFESIHAPRFVADRFVERHGSPGQRWYPFHSPNLLLSAVRANVEVYAHLSKADGYCGLICPADEAADGSPLRPDRIGSVLRQLVACGASYVEVLLPLDRFDEINTVLACGFVPSAAYPAMRREGELYRDYVVMARTMRPLDFRDAVVDAAFRPYVDQYIASWNAMYLTPASV